MISHAVPAATHPTLIDRVLTLKAEIEADLEELPPGDRGRLPLENALSQVEGLIAGDPEHVPSVVAHDLNIWLEANKYITAHSSSGPVRPSRRRSHGDAKV
jgi:hypothetical protein